MHATARTGPGCRDEPGTPFKFPQWVAGIQVLESPSAVFPVAIPGSWIESGVGTLFLVSAIWDMGSSGLIHCATTPTPGHDFY